MSCTHENLRESGSPAVCCWQWCRDCGAHRVVIEHYAEDWEAPRGRAIALEDVVAVVHDRLADFAWRTSDNQVALLKRWHDNPADLREIVRVELEGSAQSWFRGLL